MKISIWQKEKKVSFFQYIYEFSWYIINNNKNSQCEPPGEGIYINFKTLKYIYIYIYIYIYTHTRYNQ